MTKRILAGILFLLAISTAWAQIEKEIIPPYNIKTATFTQNGINVVPLIKLGDSFQFSFDDLFGNEANYYYVIQHCDYDWKPSQLVKAEYLQGFDEQRIQDYQNSFNALQLYSHYKVNFPNPRTRLLVSGNYMLKILNEDRDVVFSRKFVVYEDLVSVPLQIKRARNVADVNYKHNLDFSIKSPNILFQSPLKNVKVLLLQNGNLNTAITNVPPMYTIGNDLIYKYDTETQFWGGNEFMYFENKDIRGANNFIARVESGGGLYNNYLYTNNARRSNQYTFYPDYNGNFIVQNINAENNDIEADYAWIFFSLSAPAYFGKGDIYINGMFNNYALTPEYKMDFNKDKGVFEKAIMIKQGFTNYQYVIADKNGKIDHVNAVDGNFYQTVSDYFVMVYYRENNQRYDRVIGRGVATSEDIIN